MKTVSQSEEDEGSSESWRAKWSSRCAPPVRCMFHTCTRSSSARVCPEHGGSGDCSPRASQEWRQGGGALQGGEPLAQEHHRVQTILRAEVRQETAARRTCAEARLCLLAQLVDGQGDALHCAGSAYQSWAICIAVSGGSTVHLRTELATKSEMRQV